MARYHQATLDKTLQIDAVACLQAAQRIIEVTPGHTVATKCTPAGIAHTCVWINNGAIPNIVQLTTQGHHLLTTAHSVCVSGAGPSPLSPQPPSSGGPCYSPLLAGLEDRLHGSC